MLVMLLIDYDRTSKIGHSSAWSLTREVGMRDPVFGWLDGFERFVKHKLK